MSPGKKTCRFSRAESTISNNMKNSNVFKNSKPELLAPAGNFECLQAALHFGADAVYFSGKNFGLRAGADNFSNEEELAYAVALCHEKNKKAYIAVNVFAHNADFKELPGYLMFLSKISVDGLIVSDPGVFSLSKQYAPNVPIHLSTQANTTNRYAAAFWAEQGAERIVLAREMGLSEIRELRNALPSFVELEAFVHGAMCIAYSGRCLLSGVLTGRSGNRGACAQSCRWEYEIREKTRDGKYLTLTGDERGSYILNSKDMNLLRHLDKLTKAGIKSFKIEGRAKGAYYVANTVNAYRRAIDYFWGNNKNVAVIDALDNELYKAAHREYFTGFYFNDSNEPDSGQHVESSSPVQSYQFIAAVTGEKNGLTEIEQRNRFYVDDELEVLSPDCNFNKSFCVKAICDKEGNFLTEAKRVQQILFLETGFTLRKGDMLRKKIQA